MAHDDAARMQWRKSSRSLNNGTCVEVARTKSSYSTSGACVEVAWVKSSRSATNGTCVEVGWSSACADRQCVEVGHDADVILVRDSKDPDGPVLRFDAAEWSAFVAGVKDGQFD